MLYSTLVKSIQKYICFLFLRASIYEIHYKKSTEATVVKAIGR